VAKGYHYPEDIFALLQEHHSTLARGHQLDRNTVAKGCRYPVDTVAWQQENRSKLEKEHHPVETLPLLQDYHSTVAKGH